MREWRKDIVLGALLLLLAFSFQGTRGLFSPDEGFYAVVAKTMADTGDFFLPRIGHDLWLDKPPLSQWGIAAGLEILGPNEWGVRLFHGLAFVLTALLTAVIGREFFGARAGRIAALLYATMVLPFVAANVVTPDTPLTLCTTAAMAAFWFACERPDRSAAWWKVGLGLALGLGFFTKGPAALIPASAMFVYLVLTRSVKRFFVSWSFAVAAAVFLAVGLSWYVGVALTVPGSLEYFWENQVSGRLVTSAFRRNPGLSGFLAVIPPVVLLGTLPASLVWWLSVPSAARKLADGKWWRTFLGRRQDLLVASWIVAPLVLLSIASSKLPLYLLPEFPAFAVLSARLLRARQSDQSARTSWLGLGRRTGRALMVWMVFLVIAKFWMSSLDHKRNMRSLAHAIDRVAPEAPYEILCGRIHCEGVAFYLDQPVDLVATADVTYPYFRPMRQLSEAYAERDRDGKRQLIVYEDLDEFLVRQALAGGSERCTGAGALDDYGRRAIICYPETLAERE